MLIKLGLIVLIAALVFWWLSRAWPQISQGVRRRVLPLLFSPFALPVLRRVVMLLLRLLFRR